jgi:hypothetical protein
MPAFEVGAIENIDPAAAGGQRRRCAEPEQRGQ